MVRPLRRRAVALLLLMRGGNGAPSLSALSVSGVSGTSPTFVATSSGSLEGGSFGVEFGVGAYTNTETVEGAASSQSITIDFASYAIAADATVQARVYYNIVDTFPTDAAENRVYFDIPAFVQSATLSGTETEGDTLTGSNGYIIGTAAITETQAWQLCDSGGANCVAITGATAETYVLTADDVGGTVKYQKNASNTAGSDSATSAASGVISSAATQYLLPASAYLNASAGKQYLTPYGYVNG